MAFFSGGQMWREHGSGAYRYIWRYLFEHSTGHLRVEIILMPVSLIKEIDMIAPNLGVWLVDGVE